MENTYGIKKITIKAKAHCYCPLGSDYYTNNFEIIIEPNNNIPDYCDVDAFIKNEIEGKSLIIESAIQKIKEFIEAEYKPNSITVCSTVADAVHSEVTVQA